MKPNARAKYERMKRRVEEQKDPRAIALQGSKGRLNHGGRVKKVVEDGETASDKQRSKAVRSKQH